MFLNSGKGKLKMPEASDVFESKTIERVVRGALLNTIKEHGPIARDRMGSAIKRVSGQVRGYLTSHCKNSVLDEAQKQVFESKNQSMKDLKIQIDLLKRKVSFQGDCLRKIRDGEVDNPSVFAGEMIGKSRKLKKIDSNSDK